MTVDPASIIALIIFLGTCVFGLVGYIRLQGNELKALLIKSLEECKEQREDCEKRSDAQQEQIDALIDGDHALAKAKRGSDVFQSVKA